MMQNTEMKVVLITNSDSPWYVVHFKIQEQ